MRRGISQSRLPFFAIVNLKDLGGVSTTRYHAFLGFSTHVVHSHLRVIVQFLEGQEALHIAVNGSLGLLTLTALPGYFSISRYLEPLTQLVISSLPSQRMFRFILRISNHSYVLSRIAIVLPVPYTSGRHR